MPAQLWKITLGSTPTGRLVGIAGNGLARFFYNFIFSGHPHEFDQYQYELYVASVVNMD